MWQHNHNINFSHSFSLVRAPEKAINESYFKCFAFCMDGNMQVAQRCMPMENPVQPRSLDCLFCGTCILTDNALFKHFVCILYVFRFNLIKITFRFLTKCFGCRVFNRVFFSHFPFSREREREKLKTRVLVPDDFEITYGLP